MLDFLNLAAELAAKIDPHFVSPNPRVGGVISRGEKVLATGAHEKIGEPHAEVLATKNFDSLAGCTVSITLEPCDDFPGKKTPSCAQRLISLAPEKIFVGSLDPHFCGKNVEKIRAAGISVEVLAHVPSQNLNPFFSHWISQNRPYVIVKLAQSLDGKITAPGGDWFSSELSRKKVHALRAEVSAILTTTETVFTDDPRLDCRLSDFPRKFSAPEAIVIGDRKISPDSKIFAATRKIHFFLRTDFSKILETCAANGIDSILVEAGAQFCSEILRQNFVDELQIFTAPKIFGSGKNIFDSEISLEKFQLADFENSGGDFWQRFLRFSS